MQCRHWGSSSWGFRARAPTQAQISTLQFLALQTWVAWSGLWGSVLRVFIAMWLYPQCTQCKAHLLIAKSSDVRNRSVLYQWGAYIATYILPGLEMAVFWGLSFVRAAISHSMMYYSRANNESTEVLEDQSYWYYSSFHNKQPSFPFCLIPKCNLRYVCGILGFYHQNKWDLTNPADFTLGIRMTSYLVIKVSFQVLGMDSVFHRCDLTLKSGVGWILLSPCVF